MNVALVNKFCVPPFFSSFFYLFTCFLLMSHRQAHYGLLYRRPRRQARCGQQAPARRRTSVSVRGDGYNTSEYRYRMQLLQRQHYNAQCGYVLPRRSSRAGARRRSSSTCAKRVHFVEMDSKLVRFLKRLVGMNPSVRTVFV